jgi:murein DD-endopeptidase MepM/ murein hydrolase activator NlpD
MSNNDLYDWTTFTDPNSGIELLNNSVRESMKADTYAGRTKFVAVALTDLIPMTALQAMGLDGANTSIVSSTSNKRFAFKARIIGDKSPHLFLPNPCDPAYAPDDKGAWSIISLHTTFLTQNIDEPPAVSRGDIVHVELEKSNATIYNLQIGKFVGLASVQDATSAGGTANSGSFCGLLGNLFDGGGAGVSGSVGGFVPATAAPCPSCNSPTPSFRVTSPFYHPLIGKTCRMLGKNWTTAAHYGIDLACKHPDPIYAIADGEVIKACAGAKGSCIKTKCRNGPPCGSNGNHVYIKHTTPHSSGKMIYTVNKHLTQVSVRKGQKVTAGEVIGTCGNTGYSAGSHLHFEVHLGGYGSLKTAVDPCSYLGRGNCICTHAGGRGAPGGYSRYSPECKTAGVTHGKCDSPAGLS